MNGWDIIINGLRYRIRRQVADVQADIRLQAIIGPRLLSVGWHQGMRN